MTRTLLTGGLVYDGTLAPPAEGDVLVEHGRILDVGTGLDGDVVVDCSGRFVSPGFFDTHVHVTIDSPDQLEIAQRPFSLQFYAAARNLRRTLDTGITTIRDAAGADLGIKEAVRRGLIAGPRMQIAISLISQTGGHGDDWCVCGSTMPFFVPHPGRPANVADGPDEVRKKVRELIRAGADVIKVATTGGVLSPTDDPRHSQFRDAEIAVMVEEATAFGIAVMAHAQGSEGIKAAVRNGVRSIEHGIYLDDEAIDLMLTSGSWLVPTLHAPQAVLRGADAGMALPKAAIEKARMVVEVHQDSVARAHQAGVRIAMGTDCGVGAHGTNLDELQLMHAAGLGPVDALHATTGSAAALMRVEDDRGTLAPGKRADLVVVEGDPLDLVDLKHRVRAVYLDGELVSSGSAGQATEA